MAYPTNFYNGYQVAPVKAARCCRVRIVIGLRTDLCQFSHVAPLPLTCQSLMRETKA